MQAVGVSNHDRLRPSAPQRPARAWWRPRSTRGERSSCGRSRSAGPRIASWSLAARSGSRTSRPARERTIGGGWGAPRTQERQLVRPGDLARAAAIDAPAASSSRRSSTARCRRRRSPQLVGAQLVSVGDGEAVFRCTPDESTYNPGGMVHGGLLCMLLDSACGCAVQRCFRRRRHLSIEIKVSFLAAAADGGELEISGRRCASGGRSRSPRRTPATARASSSATPRARSR